MQCRVRKKGAQEKPILKNKGIVLSSSTLPVVERLLLACSSTANNHAKRGHSIEIVLAYCYTLLDNAKNRLIKIKIKSTHQDRDR